VTNLRRHLRLEAIVGDVIRVRARHVALGDVAHVSDGRGNVSLARVIEIDEEHVACQVFAGSKGLSTMSRVRFLGEPLKVTYSDNILGRVFRGDGRPIDGGPVLETDPKIDIGGPIVNPVRRSLPARMIRTNVPMIDVFNALVESQKIPIFSVPGEPYNQLLARIGFQAEADVVVFGGLGLIFDDYYFFRQAFIDHGVFHRTIMFANLASDPIVERVLVPDLALAVAERFAVEQDKRVLVLLTDMTAFADSLKEIGISMEHIPSNRGYMGDLYTQLARRYEKACDFKGAGSVTILSVTTMPGDDVTHPVPDNTGYITEGQFYLHDGVLDPFGSLSRLKQRVMGKETRKDHATVMNTMIRLYAGAREAEQKKSMAFELSAFDHKLLAFGEIFRREFMDVNASMTLEAALDRSWQIMADCFDPSELLVKKTLLDEFLPESRADSSST